MTLCFLPDSMTQQAHDLLQDPGRSHGLRKIGIRWARDRDELSARLEDLDGFFEHVAPETIQDHIVVPKDCCEVVAGVVDDDVCPEGFYPIEIRRTGCR